MLMRCCSGLMSVRGQLTHSVARDNGDAVFALRAVPVQDETVGFVVADRVPAGAVIGFPNQAVAQVHIPDFRFQDDLVAVVQHSLIHQTDFRCTDPIRLFGLLWIVELAGDFLGDISGIAVFHLNQILFIPGFISAGLIFVAGVFRQFGFRFIFRICLCFGCPRGLIIGSLSGILRILRNNLFFRLLGNDLLFGVPENDLLFGVPGNDLLFRLQGNDLLFVTAYPFSVTL